MVYITGDCDKDYSRFDIENFPQQQQMTKDDYVIVCGNLGAVWYGADEPQKPQEERELDLLDSLPFTLLFIDGNRDNFEELNKYPVKEWRGGRVHEIRPGVLHLIRGEVFELCGKKIFAFGGIDYLGLGDDPITWDEEGKWKEVVKEYEEKDWGYTLYFRDKKTYIEPSDADVENAFCNLEKHDFVVDYMVTFTENELDYVAYVHDERGVHLACCAMGSFLTKSLEKIRKVTKYDSWFVGYHHRDLEEVQKTRYIYKDFIRLA